MEYLPPTLEQKIEDLPIVSFDNTEQLYNIIWSQEFTDIFTFYKQNYLPDLLRSKPELYQRISLYLTLTNQNNSFVEQTNQVLYKRICPTIEEFLTNKFYMGYANATLYPYWKEKLSEIFKSGSPIRKIIFSGCIGCLTDDTEIVTTCGNKTIATLLNNYKDTYAVSYNINTKCFEPDKIIDVFSTGVKDVYKITLDSNQIIKCTTNHLFLTKENNWISIDKGLKPKQSLLLYNEEHIVKSRKVISIEYIGKEEVFDITTEKNHNFVLNCGIIAHNSGKSTVARKAFVYVLYRILCLRYPRAVFNIDNDATIANFVIATTLKQVYEVNMLPFVKLMETMPCFQRVMSQRSFENFNLEDDKCPIPFTLEKSTGTVYFPDNIILTSGSNAQHFTGMNVVNSFADEVNDYGSIENTIALLNTLDNRFSSRFASSDFVMQSVVSSARTTNSALGEYIRHLPKNDPSILKLSPKLYEVKPDPEFKGDGTTFPVMVGNGSIPSKIITDPGEIKAIEENTYLIPNGCEIIHVPTVYKSKFELQLDQSIQDIAGMTTSDNNMVFRDTSLLEDLELTPEMYLEINLLDNVNILEQLQPYNLFEKTISGQWQFKRAPKAERFIHLDLATGGENHCDAGLCMLHKESQVDENTGITNTIYVVDLLLAINAKTKIDLTSIQKFILDLVTIKQIPIHTVTADQYQSEILLQQLTLSGYFTKVNKLSVDIKLEPYMNLASLIEKGQIKIGKCPKLKKELEALVIEKNKVTRTTELKDLADALTGAVWNAQVAYDILPVYNYVSIKKEINNTINYDKYIDINKEYLLSL